MPIAKAINVHSTKVTLLQSLNLIDFAKTYFDQSFTVAEQGSKKFTIKLLHIVSGAVSTKLSQTLQYNGDDEKITFTTVAPEVLKPLIMPSLSMKIEMTEVNAIGVTVAGGIHLHRPIEFYNCDYPASIPVAIPAGSTTVIDKVLKTEFKISEKCGIKSS
jgi:hypothetical protein